MQSVVRTIFLFNPNTNYYDPPVVQRLLSKLRALNRGTSLGPCVVGLIIVSYGNRKLEWIIFSCFRMLYILIGCCELQMLDHIFTLNEAFGSSIKQF